MMENNRNNIRRYEDIIVLFLAVLKMNNIDEVNLLDIVNSLGGHAKHENYTRDMNMTLSKLDTLNIYEHYDKENLLNVKITIKDPESYLKGYDEKFKNVLYSWYIEYKKNISGADKEKKEAVQEKDNIIKEQNNENNQEKSNVTKERLTTIRSNVYSAYEKLNKYSTKEQIILFLSELKQRKIEVVNIYDLYETISRKIKFQDPKNDFLNVIHELTKEQVFLPVDISNQKDGKINIENPDDILNKFENETQIIVFSWVQDYIRRTKDQKQDKVERILK